MSIEELNTTKSSAGMIAVNAANARPIIQAVTDSLLGKGEGESLDGRPMSHARTVAIDKLKEAAYWLGVDMFESIPPETPEQRKAREDAAKEVLMRDAGKL